jgi:plastocyanin
MKLIASLVVILGLLIHFPVWGLAGEAQGIRELRIIVERSRFVPKTFKVKAGSTVRFVLINEDKREHAIVSETAGIPELWVDGWKTGTLKWTAPQEKGTYIIECVPHPGHEMTLEVE